MSTRHRVLVVDDEEGIQFVLEDILSSEGYEVLLASNGQEALEILALNSPDIIVLDLTMPKMSGMAFREKQRQLTDGRADIPLVILSGTRDAQEQAVSMDASAVITKPFDIDEIVAVLASVLACQIER